MRKPLLLAMTAAILFGAATPFSKILLSSIPPFQLAGLLYLGAAIGVGALLTLHRERLVPAPGFDRKNATRLGFAILCGGVLGPVFLLRSLQLASSGSVSLWLVLEMVLTALLGQLFFRDPLGKWGWVGAAGCLSASLLLSIGDGSAGWLAGAWAVLACLAWGIDNHLTALIDGLKPMQSTFLKGLVAGSVNLGLGWVFTPAPIRSSVLFPCLLLGALSYGASIACYIRSAQSLGATRSQMIFSSAPFFGLLLSVLVLHQWPSWMQAFAASVFLGSVFLLFRDRHAHPHSHEALDHIHGHRHDDGHHTHNHPGEPANISHSHRHVHEPMAHAHPHWPDLHHRHIHHG
jgi:drug/metabolite transporter (DMT)-like permease